MTFLRTFVWELMQWIAIVGLVLVVAILWMFVRFLRVGMSALTKTLPLSAFLDLKRDDDA